MPTDHDDGVRRLHEERAAAADRAAPRGRQRAEAARTRAAAARARGDGAAAAFQEDVAAYHDLHEEHEERHRSLEVALADGETIEGFERRTGRTVEEPTPAPPTPPRRANS